MNNFLDALDTFIADRLDQAENRLDCNEAYQYRHDEYLDFVQSLKDTLTSEQDKQFSIVQTAFLGILHEQSRNAYRAGLLDGLKLAFAL